MKSIKHLPRNVYSSLRSSAILFDLPRVVEELIYNSVDACATKVFISLNVGACYVEVEDDGCGISRDGLVLLGERQASSKLDILDDMTTDVESLAFRGETLGSLSDVSLVEIRTKARGKPHAYCKIIKGWKCLFLGIDDQREGVGTTVIIRDLFYNQPVRRKYLHSSPKSVLHSVRKSVLQAALVHPQITFRVMDKGSECELLCTIPSTSPLRLVSDSFGNGVSSCLHEIAFADQVFKLLGYLSGPTDASSMKALQYLYINSRFVCKGPIHTLLNKLAATSQCPLTLLRVEHDINSGKRQRNQGYPAYLLNLHCPPSSFELTFGPSKTTVEFKDWPSVLAFFEKAIRHLWKEFLAKSVEEKSFSHQDSECIERAVHAGSEPVRREVQEEGTLKISDKRKRRCDFQNLPTHSPISEDLNISSEVSNVSHKHRKLSEGLSTLFPDLKPCFNKVGCVHNTDYRKDCPREQDTFVSSDGYIDFAKSITQPSMHDIGSFLTDDCFLADQTLKINEGLKCTIDSPDTDGRSFKEVLAGSMVTPEFCPSTLCKPSRKNSLFMENEQVNVSSYTYCGGSGVCFDHSREFLHSDNLDDNDACFSCGTKNILMTPLQKNTVGSMASFSILKKCNTTWNFDAPIDFLLHRSSFEPSCSAEGNTLYNELANQIWESGSGCISTEEKFSPDSPHSFRGRSLARVNDSTAVRRYNGNLGSIGSVCCRQFGQRESDKDFPDFLNIVQKRFHETLPCTSFKKAKLENRYCSNFKANMNNEHPPNDIKYRKVCSYSKLIDETGSLCFDTPIVSHTNCYKRPRFAMCDSDYRKEGEDTWDELEYQDCRPLYLPKLRYRRSRSAPPFVKGKLPVLNDALITMVGKETSFQFLSDGRTLPENICSSKEMSQPCNSLQQYPEITFEEASQQRVRDITGARPVTQETDGVQRNKKFDANCSHIPETNAFEVDRVVNEQECAAVTLTKWRSGNSQPTVGDIPYKIPDHEDDILDISSGLLHLAGGSLVPEYINRDCLEDARVLLQLDKKFIPLIARGSLVILDQHAADERIRLEELRSKVLSGEGCSISYLDSLQDLVLPEACVQLLQNYADQIRKWGWICNMDCESFSKTMKLLRKQSYGVTLVAVPCILGINLTDKDLIEYLGQLAETDGSSTLPPAVLRILNFKACRGAIMFGDSLLPSECSLIVEELKATSLCFQCAHGRPTAVPLLDVAALHDQLSKLETGVGKTWHGLRHYRPGIERAQQRLASARRFQNG